MKVKALQSVAFSHGVFIKGGEYDMPAAFADKLVKRGVAELVEVPKEVPQDEAPQTKKTRAKKAKTKKVRAKREVDKRETR